MKFLNKNPVFCFLLFCFGVVALKSWGLRELRRFGFRSSGTQGWAAYRSRLRGFLDPEQPQQPPFLAFTSRSCCLCSLSLFRAPLNPKSKT